MSDRPDQPVGHGLKMALVELDQLSQKVLDNWLAALEAVMREWRIGLQL